MFLLSITGAPQGAPAGYIPPSYHAPGQQQPGQQAYYPQQPMPQQQGYPQQGYPQQPQAHHHHDGKSALDHTFDKLIIIIRPAVLFCNNNSHRVACLDLCVVMFVGVVVL